MKIETLITMLAALCAWILVAFAIRRWGPGLVKRSTHCPVSGQRARVVAAQQEGDFGCLRVADAVACSLFPGGPLNCKKECLGTPSAG